MVIQSTANNLHWNYFLALESDLEVVSRFVEFCESNFNVYSIEFAHLLFAASSEVDVIAKLLCQRLKPNTPCRNINEFKDVLTVKLPDLHTIEVSVPRYGLTLTPWDNWKGKDNPDWWTSYNNVKHQRDVHFKEATLKNALNALGALLILTFHHYRYELGANPGACLSPIATTKKLHPQSTLLRLPDNYYEPQPTIGQLYAFASGNI